MFINYQRILLLYLNFKWNNASFLHFWHDFLFMETTVEVGGIQHATSSYQVFRKANLSLLSMPHGFQDATNLSWY